jgi:hypothetical protein
MTHLEKILITSVLVLISIQAKPFVHKLLTKIKQIVNLQPKKDNTEMFNALLRDIINNMNETLLIELNYIKGSIQTLSQSQQAFSESFNSRVEADSSHTVYVQSLATLSKAVHAILEKQDQQEKNMVALIQALNKLTNG